MTNNEQPHNYTDVDTLLSCSVVPIITKNFNFTATKTVSQITQLNIITVTKALSPVNNFVAVINRYRQ